MADPLSVAASVVGLLTAGAQITKVLTQVINKARDAPDNCRKMRDQVEDIRSVLNQLQMFVIGTSRASRSRTSLILVDQVIVTLAACVATFSELDSFAQSLQSESEMGVLDRLRWLSKEKDMKDVLQRLESHKSSLSLMMTILTCQKQDDAEDKVDRLCDLVQQAMDRYAFLNQRLSTLELRNHGINPSPTIQNCSTLPSPDVLGDGGDQAAGGGRPGAVTGIRVFVFEELLMTSRAYKNASRDGSDCFSIVSSAGRTASWSMLSGLSLSEISQIAILAIPIYPGDISNNESYEFQPQVVDPTLDRDADTSSPLRPHPPKAKESPAQRLLGKLTRAARQKLEPPLEIEQPTRIFGVPLSHGLTRARVAISILDAEGGMIDYGYIPIVVARTGGFLKPSLTTAVDIFVRSGNPKRMMEIQSAFDSPPYRAPSPMTGYTVYDAAGVLLRFLKSLPEPVIPLASYEGFKTTLGPFVSPNFALDEAREGERASRAQELCAALPPPNRDLLFYLLDLMSVISNHSAVNCKTAERLAAAFQPSLLSGPPSVMDEEAYNEAIEIVVLLLGLNLDDLLLFPWSS